MVDSIHPIGQDASDALRVQALYLQATQAATNSNVQKAAIEKTQTQNELRQTQLEAAEDATDLKNALASEIQLSNTLRALFEKAISAMGRNDATEMTHYLIQYFKLLDAAQPGWKHSLNQGMGVKRYGATWMLASLKEVTDGTHSAQLFVTEALGKEVKTAERSQSLPTSVANVLHQTLHTLDAHSMDAMAVPPKPDVLIPTLQQAAQQLRATGQTDWSDRLQLYALMLAQLQVQRLQRSFTGRDDYLARTGLPAALFSPFIQRTSGPPSQALAWQAFAPIEHTDRVEPIDKDPNEDEQRRRRRDTIRQADKLLHIDGDEDEDAIGVW